MDYNNLDKKQLIEQLSVQQDKIQNLEKTISTQSQTEDYLKAYEATLSAILDKNSDGILIVDAKGIVLYVNPSAEQHFGRSKEELLGYEFGFPVSVEKKIDILTIRKGMSLCEVEVHIVEITFHLKPAYQLSIRDITERKKAEETIRLVSSRNEALLDSIPDIIMEVDNNKVYTWANKEGIEFFGEDVIGKGASQYFEGEQLTFKTVEPLFKGSQNIIYVESWQRNKDGEKRLLAWKCRTLQDKDGNVTGGLSSAQDITERRLSEKKLIRSERELKKAQHIAHIGSWYLDVKTKEVTWTEELYKMYGFDPKLPVPSYNEQLKFFTHESWEILSSSVVKTTETGVPYELELNTVRKDGRNGWMWVRGEALTDTEGNIIGIWGAAQDISEYKEREKQLEEALEKATESDRLKTAFLTNMSHEIRTPMNGILGFAEIIKEPTISSDDLQDYIQIIQISGARMLNTINNIVDISKIESGLVHVDIKETNINEKIEFTYNFFKPEAENKQLQLSFKNGLQLKEAIINTDNEKVYSILTNLVKNAIKFTYEGSIELGYEKKGEYLEFFVKDTGIGIKQNQREIIFERFRQGSELYSRGYEGSGLGLSIAKSYVEMLGGKIWVESEEGIGSTFYFTILYNAVSEPKTVIESIFSEKDKEIQLKKLKILIVEDDEISHSLLTRILQSINCEVFHAITGVEAVEACRVNPDLDLILMDIRMPNMDGHEATRQIRQFNKDVIIIAQTAYAFSGDKEKALEAGCNSYITKPINKTLLFELIHKHLNK